MSNNKSLIDRLVLHDFHFNPEEESFEDTVAWELRQRYGISRNRLLSVDRDKDSILSDDIKYSERGVTGLIKVLFGSGDVKYNELQDHIDSVIGESSSDEFRELTGLIADRLADEAPLKYYEIAVGQYSRMMRVVDDFSYALLELGGAVEPKLAETGGYLTNSAFMALVGSQILGPINPRLPSEHTINPSRGFSTADLQTLQQAHEEMDDRRSQFHKHILAFAKQHFGKDYLDVYADITAKDYITEHGLRHIVPPNKRDSIVFVLGHYALSNQNGSYSRDYGDPVNKTWEAREADAAEKLDSAIGGNYSGWNYSSMTHRARTWAEDDIIAERVRDRYPEFVAFTGNFFKLARHGKFIIHKVLEIDMGAIKGNDPNPERKMDEIRDYIRELAVHQG